MNDTAGEPAIEIRNFSFHLEKKQILRDVSFTVRRGEYLSIVGPNGAGKTTLLKCIDRILAGGAGEIRVFGRDLASYRQRELARRISYVPQADARVFPFTVEQFVLMGRYPYLSPCSSIGREDRRAVREALEMTGTTAFADRSLDTLSGGERQKVYIAAALTQGADVLLLDEPTTFLDYRHQVEIRDVLARANAESGVTIVAVTHDVNRAALDSDRIVAVRDGAVAFCGAPVELMAPEVLERIFHTPLLLVSHPQADLPVIVPQGSRHAPRAVRRQREAVLPQPAAESGLSDWEDKRQAADGTRSVPATSPGSTGRAAARQSLVLMLLLALVLGVLAVAPFIGMEEIPVRTLWQPAEELASRILWRIRIPRVAMAFLAGSALAAAGLAFQAMFRNPLATPFTLGVASGASLGASVYIHLGLSFSLLGIPGGSWFAFAGAWSAILLVYGLTRVRQGVSTGGMLLAGVAVSFFFSSLILFLQYLSDFTRTYRMLRWVMGGLNNVVGSDEVLSALPVIAAGAMVVLYLTHELNLITTGEELAIARGVNVHRTKLAVFFTASLMVGAVVAVCGPIGFVGLMGPHICRLLIGPDHRYLTPATLLFGGAFLVICDTVARTVLAPTELPVGILTALLGGPFFLWLLLSRSEELR